MYFNECWPTDPEVGYHIPIPSKDERSLAQSHLEFMNPGRMLSAESPVTMANIVGCNPNNGSSAQSTTSPDLYGDKRELDEAVTTTTLRDLSSILDDTSFPCKRLRRGACFGDTEPNGNERASSEETFENRQRTGISVSFENNEFDLDDELPLIRDQEVEVAHNVEEDMEMTIVEDDTENTGAIAQTEIIESSGEDDLPLILRTLASNHGHRSSSRALTRESRSREIMQMKKETLESLHPELAKVWDELDANDTIDPNPINQPLDLKLALLPFQKEGVAWMREQEYSEFCGGILADEMGMGKTIQMISLLLSKPRRKPNLVIAPTVALMQWYQELTTHTGALSVLVFHGSGRTDDTKQLKKYHVVLTTYSIIESAFRKQMSGLQRNGKAQSLLHQVRWHRIILDEAHSIKNRSSNTARSVFALNSKYKWALTGTPLQNRVGELYSLLRFLRADPYSHYYCQRCPCKSLEWKFDDMRHCDSCGHPPMNHICWWNQEILKPIQSFGANGEGKLAFAKLGRLLDRIMLRRTKLERADDLGLPPRNVMIRYDHFNEEEKDVYESLYTDSLRKFDTYVQQGTVLNNYANIFDLLMKMRQVINHPDLVLSRDSNRCSTLVCGICNGEPEEPVVAKCKHVFCREDVNQYLQSYMDEEPLCPICFTHLTIDLDQPTYEILPTSLPTNNAQNCFFRSSIVNRIDMKSWRSSTKIEALVEELTVLRRKDSTIKSIVFSQFVSFLDLIQWRLSRAGFSCCRLDGRIGPVQRDAVIKAFMTKPELTVFLISLKAGGVALNLTEASQVFIMDPWWNPAVENQAMDRIHRLGQIRPIRITRLIVENSIESRIVQLQEKKKALFDSTIGRDMLALSRLSEEDLRFLFVL